MSTRMWIQNTNKRQIFEITNLESLQITHSSPVSPMPLPEETSEDNILVKIEGNSETINVSWTLVEGQALLWGSYNEGQSALERVSNEWVPRNDETISSVIEAHNKIKEDFTPTSVDDAFVFRITQDTNSTPDDDADLELGNITSVSFDVSGRSPINWNVRVSFIVGDVVTMFENDLPERPTITSLTSSNSTSFTVGWKEWDAYIAGEEPTFDNTSGNGVIIGYKKIGKGHFHTIKITDANNLDSDSLDIGVDTVSSITAGEYIVKVAHFTTLNSGRYLWSKKKTITVA